MQETIIITDEELELLFPNEIQREIFKKMLTQVLRVILERTSLHGVMLTT